MAVRETLELDIRRALAQAKEVGSAYERELRKAGASIGQQSVGAATERGLRGISDASRAAKKGLDETAEAERRAAEEARRAAAAQKEHEAALSKLGVTAGIAGAAIAAGMGIAVKSFMSFEQQMAMVNAVSSASGEQMKALSEQAMQLGRDTFFTATQAAEAQTELAKAGISVKDILGGGLAGALALATAGQLSLADSARIAAQTMQIFSLRGTDVGHIADVLAAGANKSTASVGSLGEGLSNVGGVAARLFNMTLEETVGVLALFDQNSLRGAEGGTALRSALLSLASPSEKQKEAMKAINLEIYDAQGNFIGLAGLAGALQKSLGGATQEQRNFALATIFGTYGIRAANILLQEGEAGVRKWTKAVNDQGAAAQFSSTIMDTLSGDIEQLKGSIETGLIGAGSQGNQILRFMAQRATEAVNGISQLPGPIQAAGFGLAGISAAGLGALFVVGSLAPKFMELRQALSQGGLASQFMAQHMGSIAKVGVGLAGAVISFQMIGQSAEASALGVAGLVASGALIGSTFGPQGAAIGAAVGGLVGLGKALFDAGESADELDSRMAKLAGSLTRLGEGASARKWLTEVTSSMPDVLAVAEGNLKRFADEFRSLAEQSPANAEKVLAGLRAMRDEAGKPLFNEQQLAMFDVILEKSEKVFQRRQATAKATSDADKQMAADAIASSEAQVAAAEEAQKAWEDYVQALVSGVPSVQDAFQAALSAAEDFADKNNGAFDPAVFQQNLQSQLDALRMWADNVRYFAANGMLNLAAEFAKAGPASAAAAQGLRDAGPEWQRAADDTIGATKTETEIIAAWLSTEGARLMSDGGKAAGLGGSTGVGTGITEGTPAATSAAQALADASGAAMDNAGPRGSLAGTAAAANFAASLGLGTPAASGAAQALADAGAAALDSLTPRAATSGSQSGISWSNALSGTRGAASEAGHNVWQGAADALDSDTSGLGGSFSTGFAEGIQFSAWLAAEKARAMAAGAVAAARAALWSQSPSKKMFEVGEDFTEGLSLGIESGTGGLVEAATNVAQAAADAVADTLTGDDLLIARSAALASGAPFPGAYSGWAPPTPTSSSLTDAQIEASRRRAAENVARGINANSLTGESMYVGIESQGYVSPPVGVRSSWLWSQAMVDAYEQARPLADRLAEAEAKVTTVSNSLQMANAALEQAAAQAYRVGMGWSDADPDATLQAYENAKKAAEVAQRTFDEATAAVEALKNGTVATPAVGTTPTSGTLDGGDGANWEKLAATMSEMLAVEQSVANALTKGVLAVEIVKDIPRPPSPVVGTISVQVNLPAGTPAETAAAARSGAEAGVSAATAEVRSLVASIKAL